MNTMSVPAVFYSDRGDLMPNISVREHAAPKLVGDLAGTNLSYSEVHERPTTIVIMNDQFDPKRMARGANLILSTTTGWFVDSVSPPDGITTTVQVTPMSKSDLDGKIAPDGTVIGA